MPVAASHLDGHPHMVSNSVARNAARAAAAPAAGDAAAPAADGTTADATSEALLARYRVKPSRALLARVVERHRQVVEQMAAGMATRLPPSVDVRDLVHAGLWGLMQAIEVYQPDRCDQFQAFMRIRVRGAMLDELRAMDFLPRLFRRRVRERDATRARLRMELEREPTETELAAALGISAEALLRRCEPNVVRAQTAGDEAAEDRELQLPDHGIESPIDALDRQDLIERIRHSLEPVEWKVLELHYLEGLNGKQVARRLRLSASRICQIHGRVLERLKARLSSAAGG
jgi:RNA polymerase sigma factor for flagellar operon FliA